jgi:hypothetical protein
MARSAPTREAAGCLPPRASKTRTAPRLSGSVPSRPLARVAEIAPRPGAQPSRDARAPARANRRLPSQASDGVHCCRRRRERPARARPKRKGMARTAPPEGQATDCEAICGAVHFRFGRAPATTTAGEFPHRQAFSAASVERGLALQAIGRPDRSREVNCLKTRRSALS